MKIIVNGLDHVHQGNGSLRALLEELKANPEAVAVMLNDHIVPKAQREAVTLKDGDRLEVLVFMGGG